MITTTTSGPIEVHFLSQIDGQVTNGPLSDQPAGNAIDHQALQVASLLATFVGEAAQTLDICIYDFRLELPDVADAIVSAINDAADRGVTVRIAYDKNEQDDQEILKKFRGAGGDPAPTGTSRFLRQAAFSHRVQIRPVSEEAIASGSRIMHNKYMIRDAGGPAPALWTGSANFTVDAWALQENNIVILNPCPDLVPRYQQDFDDLWEKQKLSGTAAGDAGSTTVGDDRVDYGFSPGEGSAIEKMIADAIGKAQRRVRIASMVTSSVAILQAIKDQLDAGLDVQGIYDYGETHGVLTTWSKYPKDADKVALLEAVTGRLVAKHSLPFNATAAHNFMHDKIAVADDLVVTGSFNFSTNATHNAENSLCLHDASLAGAYATYIDDLVSRYR